MKKLYILLFIFGCTTSKPVATGTLVKKKAFYRIVRNGEISKTVHN